MLLAGFVLLCLLAEEALIFFSLALDIGFVSLFATIDDPLGSLGLCLRSRQSRLQARELFLCLIPFLAYLIQLQLFRSERSSGLLSAFPRLFPFTL